MKRVAVMLIVMGFSAAAAAQNAIPDLKGTWTGKGQSVVYGSNQHHPGGQAGDTPRVQEIEFSFVVTGQEGRGAWGYNLSSVAQTREPFAWSLSTNGRTAIGADTDGYYQITLESADLMELCYAHNRLSPSGSIVTSCALYKRVQR
jgi:hypothetical protein